MIWKSSMTHTTHRSHTTMRRVALPVRFPVLGPVLAPVVGLALVCLLLLARPSHACTSFLITPGASNDGSTMITYAADSHELYGELVVRPAAVYPPGSMVDVYEWDTGKLLGRIEQALRTYLVVGNMNERQVAIAETTFGGREELQDPTATVDYGSLIYFALQRAASAREAIKVMTDLVARYGYASEGESFSISDPREAWLLEMIGKGPGRKGAVWVARRVPDGMVSAHANRPRIQKFPLADRDNCLYAPDVISFAREQGYFKGRDQDFSFADAYAPANFGDLRFCDSRVWRMFDRVAPSQKLSPDFLAGKPGSQPLPLWVKPDRKLAVADVMALMRDHFEGTPFDLSKGTGAGPYSLPYRWRPLTFKVDGVEYLNERATSTQQTGFSMVTQSRAALPDPIGGVMWFGVDDTFSTVYVPMYCGMRQAPHSYGQGVASLNRFSWDSAFWVFNWVANFAYSRYVDIIADIQVVQRELEGDFLARQAEIERAAREIYKSSPEEAREYLGRYSRLAAERTVGRWRQLGEALLVKYMDGNVKDERGGITHPDYPEEWRRKLARDDGARIRVGKLPGEPPPHKPIAIAGYFHSREELGGRAKEVPADFPFGREKLVLLAGTARCGQPPRCCLAPKPDAATGKLVVEVPSARKDPCGAPGWLIRIPVGERRELSESKQGR